MRRYAQRLTFGSAALLVCTLFLLGATSRAAHAQFGGVLAGTEFCVFEATAPAVTSLPADRTFTISGITECTLSPPPLIEGVLCNTSEEAVSTLGGEWDVHFNGTGSPSGKIVDFTTKDLSRLTMSDFTLCSFSHKVNSHTMSSQTFSVDVDSLGLGLSGLTGASTDRIRSRITVMGMSMIARASKSGTYGGTITNFTGPGVMTLNFEYNGVWIAKEISPGLSPLGVGVLTALLMGGGGFLLWRKRLRSTHSAV